MAREIRLESIGDHFEDKVINTVRDATLRGTELIKKATPNAQPADVNYITTGNLFRSWQTEIKPFVGEVFTNVEYAEPVAYGTNLPKSWGGRYRTNQGTLKGYPELIAKQLEQYISDRFRSA
tara:strand:- start:178 stop:543 length:366 start_codon:yes stop_codon:yes gene_type:complete